MEWDPQELRLFVTIARFASFRAAAEDLNIAPSSASHAIRRLERRIGTRLFHRTTRSVAVTEAGARLLHRIGPLLDGIDLAVAEAVASEGEIVGSIRISAPNAVVRYLLRGPVPRFRSLHPAVVLELRADDRPVDIVAEGCDAGIRLRENLPLDMIVAPLTWPARFVVVASPEFLATSRVPEVPLDLLSMECIRMRLPNGRYYSWELQSVDHSIVLDVQGSLILNSVDQALEASLMGLGVGFVLESQANDMIANGRLVHLLSDWSRQSEGVALYYPANRWAPPALCAFRDFIQEWFSQQGS